MDGLFQHLVPALDLALDAQNNQARGMIGPAFEALREARRIAKGLSCDPLLLRLDATERKLRFQTDDWDPVWFNPEQSLAEAEHLASRHTLGCLWRCAFILGSSNKHSEKGEALKLFQAHEELSGGLGSGHETGNGIYVAAHVDMLHGRFTDALDRFERTASLFALERAASASPYFGPRTKLGHLLASASIAFARTDKDTKRALFALALAGLILDSDAVIVRTGGGLKPFVETSPNAWEFALEYLSATPACKASLRRSRPAMAAQFEAARDFWDSCNAEDREANRLMGVLLRDPRALVGSGRLRKTASRYRKGESHLVAMRRLISEMDQHLKAARNHAQSTLHWDGKAERLPITQKFLAELCDVSPPTVCRALKENSTEGKKLSNLWRIAQDPDSIMRYRGAGET